MSAPWQKEIKHLSHHTSLLQQQGVKWMSFTCHLFLLFFLHASVCGVTYFSNIVQDLTSRVVSSGLMNSNLVCIFKHHLKKMLNLLGSSIFLVFRIEFGIYFGEFVTTGLCLGLHNYWLVFSYWFLNFSSLALSNLFGIFKIWNSWVSSNNFWWNICYIRNLLNNICWIIIGFSNS